MRTKDIQRGMRVWTRVGNERVQVEVRGERMLRGRRRFVLTRVDNGLELPKLRSPQSLRVSDGRRGEWPSMTERQDRPLKASCVNGCTHCSCAIDGGRCEYDESRYDDC